jgi:cyclophilin family peptidyl-prolyl cis-trans isomerase
MAIKHLAQVYCQIRTSQKTLKPMKKPLIALLLAMTSAITFAADKVPAHPHIEMVTSLGTIKLELDGKQAPITVAHILKLVDSGYYDGTIFHRVIPGFMAQGGGYTPSLKLKEKGETIVNESGNGMTNLRGTIAMARLGDPHSANSQFFINVADNDRLDPTKDPYNGRWGYTVFGYVIEGMEVVDEIVNTKSGPAGKFPKDVPVVPVIIKKVSRVTYE